MVTPVDIVVYTVRSRTTDIPVTTYDGRAWLAASHDKYDVIMVDAYQDITIPFQMSSTEFFTMVREHLNPGGVMVVNMNMISDGQGSINEALSDTIASVFGNGNTLTADVPNTTNRELFAKKPGSGSEENSMQQASKALNLRETTYERTGSEDLELVYGRGRLSIPEGERTGLSVDYSHRRQGTGRSTRHACHRSNHRR